MNFLGTHILLWSENTLKADVHLSPISSKSSSSSNPYFLSRTSAESLSSPCHNLQRITQNFDSYIPSLHSLLYPRPQLQEVFLGVMQSTPAREAGRLAKNLYLHNYSFKLLSISLATTCKSSPSSFRSPYSLIYPNFNSSSHSVRSHYYHRSR